MSSSDELSSNIFRSRIRIARISIKINKLHNLLRSVYPLNARNVQKIIICIKQVKKLFKVAEFYNDVDQHTREIFYRMLDTNIINEILEKHKK